MTPAVVDDETIAIEPARAVVVGPQQLMRIKGRAQMLAFTRDTTMNGLVIASDREHQQVFVLRWSGFERGMAAGLGALSLDRARDADAFRAAAQQWTMPPRRIVFSDADGHTGTVEPRRHGRVEWNEAEPHASEVADRALFAHLIHRFDVGPLARPADDAPLQMDVDVTQWDRSTAVSAPGESGAPASPHYSDAAARWSAGESFGLWFSDAAVQANAEATLTLTPRR
jgi:acyl-homoserine lactone acylase PvdQ